MPRWRCGRGSRTATTGCARRCDPPHLVADDRTPAAGETRGAVTCPSLSLACPVPAPPSHLWSTDTDVFRITRRSSGLTHRPDPLAGSTRASSSTSARTTTPATASAGPPGSTSSRCAAAPSRAPTGWSPARRRRRHRARHPQDRQGGRRLPARAGRPRRPRRSGRDGRQALPRRGAPHLPPQQRLHRGPPHRSVPRRPRAQAKKTTPGRAVAAGQWASPSGTRSSASGPPASRSPTRCRSTAPRS